ncbi:MAG: HEAT repeat domain-containing protein [Vicinamibacterales bacterium]
MRERIADLLRDTLDASRAREVQQHVASCADCQAEFADLQSLWEGLARIPEAQVPSTRMRERFSAVLAAERASTEGRPASRPGRRRAWAPPLWPGEPLAQLAIAASLLIVGVVIGRNWPAASATSAAAPSTEISEVRSELRDMRQMLTLSLLQQQSATERLRGVSSTAQIDQPGNEVVSALLDTLLHDPNVNVRLAAVDALRRFSDRSDVRLGTKQAIADRNAPLLQVAVIDFMVETRDPEAPALFRSLAADASVDEAVRGRAQWGLDRLAS